MSLPHAEEAREFYQAAKQRLADSYLLLDHGRTTGSMYLAGYAVECMLKALVLSALPRRHRAGMIGAWIQRGKGHDLEWLKRRYNQLGGPGLPSDIKGRLMLVNTWSTSWRYGAGTRPIQEAKAFIRSVEQILDWADGRL